MSIDDIFARVEELSVVAKDGQPSKQLPDERSLLLS